MFLANAAGRQRRKACRQRKRNEVSGEGKQKQQSGDRALHIFPAKPSPKSDSRIVQITLPPQRNESHAELLCSFGAERGRSLPSSANIPMTRILG